MLTITYIGMDNTWINYVVTCGNESFKYFTGLGWFIPEYNKRTGKRNAKPVNSKHVFGGWVKLPTETDVLECLYSDSEAGKLSFNDFCDEFGYDKDSIKALDTYRACMDIADKLTRLERAKLISKPVASDEAI